MSKADLDDVDVSSTYIHVCVYVCMYVCYTDKKMSKADLDDVDVSSTHIHTCVCLCMYGELVQKVDVSDRSRQGRCMYACACV